MHSIKLMLCPSLAGSASFATMKQKIKLALKWPGWGMNKSFTLTASMEVNGCAVMSAKRLTTWHVLLPKLRNKLKQRAGHLSALLINVNKRVNARSGQGRSTLGPKRVNISKRVIKRVIFFSSEMAKQKFSKKGRHGKKGGKKKGQTEEEKRDAMSHKGQRNQKWKAEQMDEAQKLLKQNDDLPDNKKLSYRAIARQTGVPVTTIIERLSGRRKGRGHIAGGARKPRVLSDGKFKRVIKRVKITVTVTVLTELLTEVASGSPSGSFLR